MSEILAMVFFFGWRARFLFSQGGGFVLPRKGRVNVNFCAPGLLTQRGFFLLISPYFASPPTPPPPPHLGVSPLGFFRQTPTAKVFFFLIVGEGGGPHIGGGTKRKNLYIKTLNLQQGGGGETVFSVFRGKTPKT